MSQTNHPAMDRYAERTVMLERTLHRFQKTIPVLSYGWDQFAELVFPTYHSQHIRRHRADLILSRVHLVAAIFAVFTPLWIIVDLAVFDWPLWGILAVLRVGSGLAFAALAWPHEGPKAMRTAYFNLALMLAIPPTFFLISHPFLSQVAAGGIASIVAHAYSLLPFIVVAGLSVFPLTILEVVLFSLPIVVISLVGAAQVPGATAESLTNTVWLLLLVMGVSVFSGMSQLNYMIALINQASHDALTRAFTRRSGEEALDLQFRISVRTGNRLALAFIDIDNFKSINDQFGHEEGDKALRTVAASLRTILRRSDMLIRWGGEEFLVLLPNTDPEGVRVVMQRFHEIGLGMRPDGTPITASVGIAERIADLSQDWPHMVELADSRMYQAKKSGKNCCISVENERIG